MTDPPRYQFVLYVAGDSELSQAAQRNFAEIARRWLPEQLVDLHRHRRAGRFGPRAPRRGHPHVGADFPRTGPKDTWGDLSDLRRVAEAIGVSTFDE